MYYIILYASREMAIVAESTLHVLYVIFHILIFQMHAGAWELYNWGFTWECVLGDEHGSDLNIFVVRDKHYIRHVTSYMGEA